MKATHVILIVSAFALLLAACGPTTVTQLSLPTSTPTITSPVQSCVPKGTTIVFTKDISDQEKAQIAIENLGLNENKTIGGINITVTINDSDGKTLRTSSKAIFATLIGNSSAKVIFDGDLELGYNSENNYLLLTWDGNECMSHEYVKERPEMTGSPSTSIPPENRCSEGQIQVGASQEVKTETEKGNQVDIFFRNQSVGLVEVTVISNQGSSIYQSTKQIFLNLDSNGNATLDMSNRDLIAGDTIAVSLNLHWQDQCLAIAIPE